MAAMQRPFWIGRSQHPRVVDCGVVNKPIFLLGLAGHKMIIRDEAVDMK